MKTKSKALLMSLCAVLLVAAAVFGTLAYLTDEDSVTNTFTVGQVGIILDEADVDEDGVPITGAPRVQVNDYHLIPGHTYVKDPTVTVDANSEEAYVRMLVKVENITQLEAALPKDKYPQYYGNNDVFLLQNLVDGWYPNIWACYGYNLVGTTGVYEFRYHTTVEQSADATVLPALFTTIELPGEHFDNNNIDKLNGLRILVEAHAIQADGFETADLAWAAFQQQNPTPAPTENP